MDNKDKSQLVWDCGSSLYDSFELNSFMQQLDSAIISSRCMSMPHLQSSELCPPPAQPRKKHYSKFSRSVQRLLRSVFGVKRMLRTLQVQSREQHKDHGAPRSGRLASIPEVISNKEAASSPEIDATVRKTKSERFAGAPPPVIS